MPLINLEQKKVLNPQTLGFMDIIQSFKKQLNKQNQEGNIIWNKIISEVDFKIKSIKPSKNNQLSWTKMAAMFGYQHQNDSGNKFVWDTILDIFGDADNARIAKMLLGSLVQWRLSLKNDLWLMYYKTTEEIDPFTGKKIRTAYYWIDNSFDVKSLLPANKRKPDHLSLAALANKFNSRK